MKLCDFLSSEPPVDQLVFNLFVALIVWLISVGARYAESIS